MIKAVVFDIDNTMYDYDSGNSIAMKALQEYCMSAFSLEEREFSEVFNKAQETIVRRTGRACAANHNRLIRFQCMLEFLGIPLSSHALQMYHIYWSTLIDVMKAEPGLTKLLKTLQNKKVSIGVGSDMTAYIQYKKLEKLKVLDIVSCILTSEEAGVEKPDPYFFQLCVEKMGCKPQECVFIGDSLRKDVQGAVRCGLHGVWYRPHGDMHAEENRYPCINSFEKCVRDNKVFFSENLIID